MAVNDKVRLLYVSPQVKGVLGYEPSELIHDPTRWMEIVHPDDLPGLIGQSVDPSATQLDCSFRMIAKDGSIIWASNRVSMISEETGERRWQGIFLDVSDRVRIEELETALERERQVVSKLRSLDEMKNTFLQAVSHELRTPLTAIKGLGATMELRIEDLTNDDVVDLIARINSNAKKLESLLGDLLDVDRLARGVFIASLAETDVGFLVENVALRLQPTAPQIISTECHPSIALTDPSKVERIAENLISNAIKHTPADTSILVRVHPEGAGLLITVEDSGPGIEDAMKATVFEPFAQWNSEARHSQGLGLGLSLVRSFAELMGGRAWVEDGALGGASFHVYLPTRMESVPELEAAVAVA
jgi:PAS domain S-box-containing protein